jgi:DNA replication protein DnaC
MVDHLTPDLTALWAQLFPGTAEPPPPLTELARLPTTTELADTLDQLQREPRVLLAQQRVRWAQLRDAFQATRPEGCWCLGEGSATRENPRRERDWYAPPLYCPCPDGQAERERETAKRHQAVVTRLLAAARIPPRFAACTFNTFPDNSASAAPVERIRYWVEGPGADSDDEACDVWLQGRKESLLIFGGFGRGKTGLAVACLKAHVEGTQEGALFTTVPDLLDAIRRRYDRESRHDDDYDENDADDLVEKVKTVAFLVLDDLGAERVTDWVAERLFVIINARHDADLPTIVTSNLAPSELGAHVGERTMWRIIEMCDVIKLDGPNLRQQRPPGTAKSA